MLIMCLYVIFQQHIKHHEKDITHPIAFSNNTRKLLRRRDCRLY